ncbi:MAG: DUF456 domain-containing protein [Candidatus Berkelbacteria bacterium]|nr:MAG: DUF456 domain-containing protein [Candidatus Berkelbacteria bacterium]QQG51929.1 MAG: DUF456 domain-containing protein [Candidatus Berkelbacteria bacterium]
MSDLLWIFSSVVLMLPAVVGIFIPVVPGIPLMFLVALVFGFINKFAALTASELVILLTIALVSIAVDYLAGVLGAKYSGASARALVIGFICMILGVLILPPFGGLIGLFIGVLVAELGNRTHREAIRAATGSLIGALTGILINFLLALLFITLFIIFAWPR